MSRITKVFLPGKNISSFLQEQKDKREGYEVIRIEQRRKFYMELSGQSSQKEDTKYINLIVETLIEVVTKLVDANDDLSVITFYSSKPGKREMWSFSIHLIFVNLIVLKVIHSKDLLRK